MKYRHYNYQWIGRTKRSRWAVVALACLIVVPILGGLYSSVRDAYATELLSPMTQDGFIEILRRTQVASEQVKTDSVLGNIDVWVGEAVDEFYVSPGDRSSMRQTIHCLLNKEGVHNSNKNLGDGGKAGGVLQFHQSTWEGMRKQMISKGLTKEVGSRFDIKEAIRTTVWAIRNGRGNEWGPILRRKCDLSISSRLVSDK